MMGDTLLLDSLLRPSGQKRERRRHALLKAPHSASPEDWFLHVLPAFNRALDIQETECVRKVKGKKRLVATWTQGSAFSFAAGDILYDDASGYKAWGTPANRACLIIEIISAVPAKPRSAGSARFPGNVRIRVSKRDSWKDAFVTLPGIVGVSQDEFLRFCISGQCSQITAHVNS